MATFFVIYDPIGRAFVRKGYERLFTNSLNFAKHFTTQWSADNWRKSFADGERMIVKKIARC